MDTVDNGRLPTCGGFELRSTLENIIFTESRGQKMAIQKLKPNLSAGPDKLPPLLFKRLKDNLARPLCLIFMQLLSVGCVSEDWTKAIITPVHKKGSAGALDNIIAPYQSHV